MVSWAWQPQPQPELTEAVKIASTIALPVTLSEKPPSWLQDVSSTVPMVISTPPWPPVQAPDFRIPKGRSRFHDTDTKFLEPPPQFVRWSDRVESVLASDREVDRSCRAMAVKAPPPGKFFRGCSHRVVGRRLITRVDDPGIARHELAHCNGWKHPQP